MTYWQSLRPWYGRVIPSRWIGDFVECCRNNQVPVDFVSTYQYVGDPFIGVADEQHDGPASLLTLEEQAEKNKELI